MEVQIKKSLFQKANQILKAHHSNFTDAFNQFMKQSIKWHQVAFGLEEYDTKYKNDTKLSLDKVDQKLLKGLLGIIKPVYVPLSYVVDGYLERVILQKRVPKFSVPRFYYKK